VRGPVQAKTAIRASSAGTFVSRGFSLLELLVALFVVVMITSMVSLTVTSGGQDIRLESNVRNLMDVASYALDEAQMNGTDYGLLLEEDYDAKVVQYVYSWHRRGLEGWEDLSTRQDVFAPQSLPEDIELELELPDAPVTDRSLDADDEEEEEGEKNPTPQVIFYASGETTEGAINVRQRDGGELLWRVEWDLLGRFELLRRGEVEEEF
jgi:general secretion pathway protein H